MSGMLAGRGDPVAIGKGGFFLAQARYGLGMGRKSFQHGGSCNAFLWGMRGAFGTMQFLQRAGMERVSGMVYGGCIPAAVCGDLLFCVKTVRWGRLARPAGGSGAGTGNGFRIAAPPGAGSFGTDERMEQRGLGIQPYAFHPGKY